MSDTVKFGSSHTCAAWDGT